MQLYFNNVNDAFTSICRGFMEGEFRSFNPNSHGGVGPFVSHTPPLSRGPSRYGSVIRIEEPVTITYLNPLKRVLFHPVRDCNPFLHLIEALWMLAGQNSVVPLAYFAKRMQEFSDDDLTGGDIPFHGAKPRTTDFTGNLMWGAYGYRWRNWFQWDQVESAISILRSDRITRRVVVSMWEPRDLQRVEGSPTCKDVPCNLLIMFSPRPSPDVHRLHLGQQPSPRETDLTPQYINGEAVRMVRRETDRDVDEASQGITLLDMTVVNRSNDTLWGALGSNYVHFSVLHEYIANAVGMGVGNYHQMTNNLHVYTSEPVQCTKIPGLWSGKFPPAELTKETPHLYTGQYNHYPLFKCPYDDYPTTDTHRFAFDNDCQELFHNLDYIVNPSKVFPLNSPYFTDVVHPMLVAYQMHKQRKYSEADHWANRIVPMDWRVNCQQWLARRAKSYTNSVEERNRVASL